MSLFPQLDEGDIYLSRSDVNELLSAHSKFGFELDGHFWPSVEHYYQAMKFSDENYQARIREAEHPAQAYKLGHAWLKRKRSDWKQIREVVMTRAIYIKCRTHPEVAQRLLETQPQKLVENNQYDYFWGCGRDRRGENKYGKVLMNVRDKLVAEQASEANQN